jgi:hypothetical protein
MISIFQSSKSFKAPQGLYLGNYTHVKSCTNRLDAISGQKTFIELFSKSVLLGQQIFRLLIRYILLR